MVSVPVGGSSSGGVGAVCASALSIGPSHRRGVVGEARAHNNIGVRELAASETMDSFVPMIQGYKLA